AATSTMQAKHLLKRRWARWGLFLGFWSFLGAINVGQSYSYMAAVGRPFLFWPSVVIGLADWYGWAALTPVILYLGQRWPFEQRRWPYSLLLHLLTSLACSLLIVALMVPLMQLCRDPSEDPKTGLQLFHLLFLRYLIYYLWIYWAVLGIGHALA